MIKKFQWAMIAVVFLSVTGCATTKTYQPEADSLNSKIAALEAKLSEKDQEIAKLRNQMGSQDEELKRAESEKRELSEKLSSAMTKLDATSKKTEQSDLK